MQSYTINDPTNENSIPIAKEVEPSACEKQCSTQQKSLVSCVDSIRSAAAAAQQSGDGESSPSTDGGGDESTTTTESTPDSCLPMAVAAWTKCCEDANMREEKAS
ncbi:hypothetical protein ACHAXR_008738 [Thalassiosira sp. AJA248-18]